MLERLILRIKQQESPFYAWLYKVAHSLRYSSLPVPRVLLPAYRLLYEAGYYFRLAILWLLRYFIWTPMFQSRCAHIGRRFQLTLLPEVVGDCEITIGDDCRFDGKVGIYSARTSQRPRLVLGDKVLLGHNVTIVVNREIVLEEGAWVASRCRLADTDSHPRDPVARVQGAPASSSENRPVRIGKRVWIGEGCYIMKGVKIGEGSIIGAGSVVVSSIPPFSVAMGNPARVILRDIDKNPSYMRTSTPPQE